MKNKQNELQAIEFLERVNKYLYREFEETKYINGGKRNVALFDAMDIIDSAISQISFSEWEAY